MTPRRSAGVPPHRVPQPVGKAHPADHRHHRTATCRTASCSPSSPTAPSELTEAANFLNQNYAGLTLRRRSAASCSDELQQLRDDMTALMTAALEAGNQAHERQPGELRALRRAQSARRAGSVLATWRACADCSTCSSRRPPAAAARQSSSARQGVQIFIGGESGLRAARRMQRGHRALRGRRPGGRHRRRDRPDPHGLRARDPDRRHHRQAAVERAVPRN